MPDEHPTRIRIAGEQPAIPFGRAAVNFSRPDSHGDFSFMILGCHIDTR
jgi:hypothetical protein